MNIVNGNKKKHKIIMLSEQARERFKCLERLQSQFWICSRLNATKTSFL